MTFSHRRKPTSLRRGERGKRGEGKKEERGSEKRGN
jgi:hypothetical protein